MVIFCENEDFEWGYHGDWDEKWISEIPEHQGISGK